MGVAVSCPRCGGVVRPPDLMHTDWRCDQDGPVLPFHVPQHITEPIVESTRARVLAGADRPLPMWCPWPLLTGWVVTGVGWVGDERSGVRATIVACSGPGPVERGPADIVLIAEEPGVGLGTRFAGIPGPDPGPFLERIPSVAPSPSGGVLGLVPDVPSPLAPGAHGTAGQAKVRADGWPTSLWLVKSPEDRCAYAGEARGLWLYLVSWPAAAGFLLAEDLVLHDLAESVPSQLVYGAPSPYLHATD
jgi:hypothetical protein